MKKLLLLLIIVLTSFALVFGEEQEESIKDEVLFLEEGALPPLNDALPSSPEFTSSTSLNEPVNKPVMDEVNAVTSKETASPDVAPQEEDDEEWYIGKEINEFRYTGLKYATANEINKLLDKYLGEEFSYSLLSSIQDDLFNYNDNFDSVEPSADRDSKGRLVILFDFVEKPRVSSIKIDGTKGLSEKKIKGELTLKEDSPFFRGDVTLGETEIINLYKSNGFREVSVDSVYEINTEKNEVYVGYTVNEGYRSRVQDITFKGNYSFSDAELLNIMKKAENTLTISGYYQDDKLQNNVEALRLHYLNNGYLDVRILTPTIEDVTTDLEEEGYRFRIVIEIQEGQMWKLGEVTFVGMSAISEDTLRKFMQIKTGDVIDSSKISLSLDGIAGEYYDNGYIYSQFNPVETRNELDGTIDLKIEINESVQAVIEDVTVSGNTKTKDYVFLREVTMKRGEVFSRQQLIKSMQNIYNTTLVSDVNYKLTAGEADGSVDVDFVVTETKQMDLTLGLTFGGNNTGFPISFLASISDKNLVGTGMKLTAGVQLTTDYQAVNLSWSDSWVGNKRWANGVSFQFERSYKSNNLTKNANSDYLFGRNNAYPNGYNSYEEWQARRGATPPNQYLMDYTMYRFSLGYNTGYIWSFAPGRLTLSGSLNFGLNKVYYNENEGMPYEYLVYKYRQAWQWSNFLSLSIQWDGRDLVQNTTKGYLISQSFTYAGGIFGGLSNYIRSNTSAAGYLTLFKVGDGIRPRALVASLTTSLGLMLPQWWNCDVDRGNTGWRWHDPKYGATKSEMLYIDGMMVSRGTDSVYDLALLWDTILELSFPIAVDIVNIEAFTSITAGAPKLAIGEKLETTWYGAFGIGARLKISGFPLGIFLVANYSISEGMRSVEWKTGGLFNYIRPVLSINMSIF